MEEEQRQELLQRSHGAADFMSNQESDAQGMSYINNSKQVIEEAFQTGTAVLANMSGQRERLKVQPCLCISLRATANKLC